jgi:hypothetical protein
MSQCSIQLVKNHYVFCSGQAVKSKTINPISDTHLDFVRFKIPHLDQSREVIQPIKEINIFKKIWYAYFSQRKIVWIRTTVDDKVMDVAFNRKIFAKHLGISNWQLAMNLREGNVVNPSFVRQSVIEAFESAESLEESIHQLCIGVKRLLQERGVGIYKLGRKGFEELVSEAIEVLRDPEINQDRYNQSLLKTLQNFRLGDYDEWSGNLRVLRDDLQSQIWWDTKVKWTS